MTAPAVPVPIQVSGGAGGIVANRHVLDGLARLYADAGAGLDDAVRLALRAAAATVEDPAGLLDPGGAAQVAAEAARAVTALQLAAEHCAELASGLRCAAAGYPWNGGSSLWGSLWGEITRTVRDESVVLGTLASTGSVGSAFDRLNGQDTALVDVVVGGLHTVALGLAVAGAVDDGTGRAIDTGIDAAQYAGRAPRSLGDVVRGLSQRNDSAPPGAVDVRIIVHSDGTRSVVVDITGTRSWSPRPGRDPADLTTNELALAGRRTAYEQGVLDAMTRAGVRPGDDVMLVGHSQGGMIAVNLARDAVTSGRFHVTHVLTCGSPVALTVGAVPASVRVLALENSRDDVVHADGRPNPDTPTVTTVTAALGDGDPGGDHHIPQTYVPIADATDRSSSVSVRDFLHSAQPFLTGASVTTHTYQVVREK